MFPAWWAVQRVLMPINIKDRHWVLADFDLDSMMFTVYDTYRIEEYSKLLKKKVMTFR